MKYVIVEHEVLTEENIRGHIVRRQHDFVKHIKLSKEVSKIIITWLDWEGNQIPFENTLLRISGNVETQTFEVNVSEIDLEGEGLSIIIETLNAKVKNDKIEVSL